MWGYVTYAYSIKALLIVLLQVGLELPGVSVVINGLVAKPELNGRKGTAVSFDEDKGR